VGTQTPVGSHRWPRTAGVLLGAFFTLLGVGCAPDRAETVRAGVATSGRAVAGRFVVDDRVVDLATGKVVPLRKPPAAPLWGEVAVVSVDGRKVLYSTFETAGDARDPGAVLGRPAIRLASLDGSTDVLVADGAVSPAWGPSGEIAYVKGSDADVRQGRPYVGHVVVADGQGASPAVWTEGEPAPYDIIGWAGQRLLVGRRSSDGLTADILALTGPGQAARIGATEGVLALGPDGDRVVLVGATGRARILSLSDGTSQSIDLALDRFGGRHLEGFQANASWVGTRLVATASVDGAPAFVVLDLAERRVGAVLRLDAARFPSLQEPYFLEGGSVVAAWATNGTISLKPGERPPSRPYVLVLCRLAEGTCSTRPLPEGRFVGRLRTTTRGHGIAVEEVTA
jgi:hypothetical protein